MTIDIMDVLKFDEALAVGQPVRVRWTSNGFQYEGVGEVVKLNVASAKVKLDHEVASYPAGCVITQNRCCLGTMKRWYWSNAILPVDA